MTTFKRSIADSAGQPWAGRQFEPNRFPDDDGTAPKALIDALSSFREGRVGASRVVEVFAQSRLLVPLVTVLGEEGRNEYGIKVDKSQELSVAIVQAPDGRHALPVFSSVEAMNKWNPATRPVAVMGQHVAASALEEGTELVVLDPTSETEFAIRRPALMAIVEGKPWVPSPESVEVARAFSETIANLGAKVRELELSSGDPTSQLQGSELTITISLVDGLSMLELEELIAELGSIWKSHPVITELVDSMAIRFTNVKR